MAIRLKTPEEIEKMRAAGRVVHKVLSRCREMCEPGVTTREIDEEAYRVFTGEGATGLFKNYPTYQPGEGFPANTCISVNDVVVHGIADDRPLEDGDILGIDCGVKLDGWCGDSATTVLVGNVSKEVRELCKATEHVRDLAIANMKPGRKWSEVARLMEQYAKRNGYGVVKDFV
ncbi:MAG: M24 family metallopeptidase, partial [Phycisphaeraceae bacterium]|nr:M24 family metallopeptidase [Phycisphaeraceae bacterium]